MLLEAFSAESVMTLPRRIFFVVLIFPTFDAAVFWFYSISVFPFWGFTTYQSHRFGFLLILHILLVSFFLLVPASRYNLRLLALICGNLLLVDIRTFFWGVAIL